MTKRGAVMVERGNGDEVREQTGQVMLWLWQFFVEVAPSRVQLSNQVRLPLAFPLFHLFLSQDGFVHGVEHLVPNKSLQSVALGEAFDDAFFVLPDSLG